VSAALVLTACAPGGTSRLSPDNWFGRSNAAPVASQANRPALNLVAEVTSLRVEPVPGGAIVHATGLPDQAGSFDSRLVQRDTTDAGVLFYEFAVEPPRVQPSAGTPTAREMIVGTFVSDQSLAGVRQIRVRGARNAQSVSR
jgi:hypothetical protein